MASFAHGFRRQMFHSVPPIPEGLDLAGKTVLVTGANAGLGLECARHFLRLRTSLLVMAVRSPAKGEAAAEHLEAEFPGADIRVWGLDMASFRSVQAFAARCERELPRRGRVDAAVLNAGLGMFGFERVAEGRRRETMLQVNYLATALLAILLLPRMKPSAEEAPREPGRLTLIGSDAALTAALPDPGEGEGAGLLDSLDRAEGFAGFAQYGVTKLLLTMFVARLASESVGADDVVVNVANPGPTWGTELVAKTGPARGAAVHGGRVSGPGPESGGRGADLCAFEPGAGEGESWVVYRVACSSGRRLGERLWDETMKELSFAKVEEVLEGLKR
ncbi:uncharacterized protein PG986_002213 [Apiospora aurea]|uniref:Uncharacterized protein n=1 Tax=Apiospora aurea TaxID=335848 RepID=A0ABR1QZY6_9PEZI